jgi:protein-S-isoprenylcysteine O-methyltransferase Ste14
VHGQKETSWLPRAAWVALHLAQVAVVMWILFGGGYQAIGQLIGREWHAGDLGRRVVLAVFSIVLWVRMTLTALYLLQRKFGWPEAAPVALATAIYQWGFTMLGAGTVGELDAIDVMAIAAYAAGGVFNTGSELQRRAFKSDPRNAGRLYTGGFFALTRHPNYFGDSLWGVGWALVTHDAWSALIVAVEVSGFVFSQIPTLDRYLESHYGDAYREWARHTKRFIPFVY